MIDAESHNRVGTYRILRLINRGGQGSVYLGYDMLLQRRVAIKIYDLPARRAARKRLVAEAQLVASLESPKIVPVHDVIESGTHLAMVMAYVPGCSLEEFLAEYRPSLGSIITVGTDVAGALAIARQERVVHGDVKPGNVLLGEDGHARLTDFGIARDARRGVSPGLVAGGSFWSLAPEHLREEEITQQADIFALGVLLYRMLCLQHPFASDGRLDTQRMLAHAPFPLSERVPPEFEVPSILEDLIHTMLHEDPRQRPGNTRGIRQVLRDVSRELPMSSGSTLLREAKPFFRAESPEDIPLQIPRELMRSGRSRKKAPEGIIEQLGYWFTGLRPGQRLGLLGVILAVAAGSVARSLDSRATAVAFAEPVTQVRSAQGLPSGLSRHWLVDRVREVVEDELGSIEVVGPFSALHSGTLYSASTAPGATRTAEETFRVTMRCDGGVCLLVVLREARGRRFSEQAVLFPDMALGQWEDALRTATQALFH